MNIVHIVPVLSKGGAERVTVDLANYAVASGNHVSILCARKSDPGSLPAPIDPRVSVRFVSERPRSRIGQYFALPKFLRANAAWLRDQDIVHCHLTFGAVAGSLIQFVRGRGGWRRPVVIETYHAVGMAIPRLDRAVHALLLRRRDAVALMAEDSYWLQFLRRKGTSATVIPNGVRRPSSPPAARIRKYRKDAGIPEDAIVLGTVSRLVRERRPEAILQIFAKVIETSPGTVHCLIAGEGAERGSLEAEIARLGLTSRIHLPGLIVEPALAFATIDLYLTLNVGPISGLAGLEAAAFGLPAVAFQLRDDYSGGAADWIWSSGNPDTVAGRITELIANATARDALAAAQSRHVRNHLTVEAMADSYQRLYAAALDRRGA